MDEFRDDRRSVLASLASVAVGGAAAGKSAAAPPVADGPAMSARVTIEAFGATGNGSDDDLAAFQRALDTVVPGTAIQLAPGRTYRLAGSLRFDKPVMLVGGTKEDTKLLFDNGAYDAIGNQRAAILLPHTSSAELHGNKGAQRSILSGFSAHWAGKGNAGLHGLLISSPVYLSEVDVHAFPQDGFRIEADSNHVKGNANGSSFLNCSAYLNGQNGFSAHGNNANACLFMGVRAFNNRGVGFYDNSLLGNSYIAAEVDGNGKGGFVSNHDLPNHSVYVGCYAEPGQKYDLNPRNIVIGPLGHTNGYCPALLASLPTGELFSPAGLVIGPDPTVAVTGNAGDYLRLSGAGVELSNADGQQVRLVKRLSSNYLDLLNGETPVLRLPVKAVTGNVDSNRVFLPAGFALGDTGRSGIVGAGSRPPINGAYAKGALWLNDEPTAKGFVGWVCIQSGSPGTWREFGRIE